MKKGRPQTAFGEHCRSTLDSADIDAFDEIALHEGIDHHDGNDGDHRHGHADTGRRDGVCQTFGIAAGTFAFFRQSGGLVQQIIQLRILYTMKRAVPDLALMTNQG